MRLRKAIFSAIAGLGVCLAALTGFADRAAVAQSVAPRQFFQVATGPTAGTYFPMGELIAGIVSHPPGVARCEVRGVCGPAGLIVSVRTSDGSVANVRAVNSGLVDAGFAQSNIVADAMSGRNEFRADGRQTHVRVMAALFPETVQLVAAVTSRIAKVADLSGKRVALGTDGSGTEVVAREVLLAYGVKQSRLKLSHDSYDVSANLLQQGKLDAFFFQGSAPSPLVGDLLARGAARLVPLDGRGRRRLLARLPSFSADVISSGLYAHSGAVQTISCRTLWVVNDTVAPDIVHGIVRALFDPANRALLDEGPRPGNAIRLENAAKDLTAPLHQGAERYYLETGVLAAPKK